MITDKKSNQKILDIPENIYKAIINDIVDSIVEIDLNGNFTYISPQCYQMFGYQPQEVIGRKALRFIHPDDLLHVINKMKEIIEDKKHISYEYRAKHKNGGYVHVSAKGGIITREGIPKLIAVVRDITEKKRGEIKLRNSEHQYRTILESIGDPIHVIDANLKVILTNNSLKDWLKEFNINKEIIGKKISDVFPFLPEKVIEEYHRIFETGETVINEEFTELNKKMIYTEVRKIPIFAEGKVVQVVTNVKDITDRKISEIKLKESEQNYRVITENSNDLIRVLNNKFEIEFVNEIPCRNLLGYSKQELLMRKSLFFNHPDDYKKVRHFMLKLFREGENAHTIRVRHKNGSWVWYENKAKMFTDELGNQKYLMISRDVTERIKAEKALKESEQKYRLITENSNDLIRVLSEEFKIEFLNEKAHQQVLGYTRDDLIGNYDTQLFPPEDYPKLRRFMLNLFKHKEEIHVSRMRHKKGYYLWFEVKTKMFKDEQGKQKYLFISRDITERRQTELALMESEEKYRNLYKNSPNAVVLSDKYGVIFDSNSSAERILGYSRNELKGRNYIEFNMVNPDQITIIKKMFTQVVKGAKPKHIELQIKKKNGTMIWILFQSSMIKLNNEIIVECIAQDITDKKKAENLIIEENKRLLELNKMKTELISRVSHELKTPITSIFGGTQILLEVYKDQTCADALEFIELINRGGKRLKILIENLLDAARIESEKMQLNLQKDNIVEIIKNCVNDNRYIANKRNMIIELNMPEVVNIEVDKMRIEQVITNLLSNAIKNTPKNGIIKITLEEKNVSVYFKIEDTGIGLTKEEMVNLFIKFGKIERYGQKMDVDLEGSGLGLYISKEIIDMHGGHIWVESAGRNMGSTFYFKLFNNMNGPTS